MEPFDDVSVVIPAFNEAGRIGPTLQQHRVTDLGSMINHIRSGLLAAVIGQRISGGAAAVRGISKAVILMLAGSMMGMLGLIADQFGQMRLVQYETMTPPRGPKSNSSAAQP